MNAFQLKLLLVSFLVVVLSACSHAPLTPRSNAASMEQGVFNLETNVSPTTSLSAAYGLSEKIDIGLDVEQAFLTTVWTRYSAINNPNGFSLAANAAVYVGIGDFESNGWYAGGLMSHQFSPKARWSLAARYAKLDYRIDDDGVGWFEPEGFDNPDDGSEQAFTELAFSWRFKPHVELNLGVACQQLLKNTDILRRDYFCLPIIGFHFFRI